MENSENQVILGYDGTEFPAPTVQFEQNNFSSLLDRLEKAQKASHKVSIVPSYKEFSTVGEKLMGVYTGTQTIRKDDKTLLCVAILTKESTVNEETGEESVNFKMYLNAGVKIVETLKNTPLGTAIEIEYLGTKKVKSGNMKNFDIRFLS